MKYVTCGMINGSEADALAAMIEHATSGAKRAGGRISAAHYNREILVIAYGWGSGSHARELTLGTWQLGAQAGKGDEYGGGTIIIKPDGTFSISGVAPTLENRSIPESILKEVTEHVTLSIKAYLNPAIA